MRKTTFGPATVLGIILTLMACAPSTTVAQKRDSLSPSQAREEIAYALGVQAYLWGFPLWYYGNVIPEGLKVGGADLNAFRKFTTLKTAKDRFVVTPNNVTIDAYANFDVTAEPVVVFVPKLPEPRWYLVQFGDAFDEIFRNVGGTKGPEPGVYVVTGPDFKGRVPGDMNRIPTRTRIGVLAVRIFASGDADLPRAVEAQKGFHLMPLSAYLRDGLAYRPTKATSITPFKGDAPEELHFFDELGFWMTRMLPVSADFDDALVASFRPIGLSVGKGFDWRSLDEPTRRGLARAATTAAKIVDARWESTGETTNGWKYAFSTGRAGHDPALRAALCKYELGAQLSDQVTYPNTRVDDAGEALTGERKYLLHFEKGKLPPVSLFWNLAMYAPDMLFVENEIHRYSIGSTTDGLKTNADGSLTIYLQKDRPEGDKSSNWLPTPPGSFNVTMRLYGPEPSVLDGSYRLPAIRRSDRDQR